MGAIDVGAAAIDRAGANGNNSVFDVGNPANATGALSSVEVWLGSNEHLYIGIFYLVSGSNYTNRSRTDMGTATGGVEHTFSGLNVAITAGDFLATYSNNQIQIDTSGGGGVAFVGGDCIYPGTYSCTVHAGYGVSLYGIGATLGWANIKNIRMGTGVVLATDIANIRPGTGSIAVADAGKFDGVPV